MKANLGLSHSSIQSIAINTSSPSDSIHLVLGPHGRKRLADKVFQHGLIHVCQPRDIEAGFPDFVVAQPRHEVIVSAEAAHDVSGQRCFAGGEAGQEHVPFTPAVVAIVVLAKADYAAPKHRRMTRKAGHDLQQGKSVFSPTSVFDGMEEVFDLAVCGAGFVWCGGHPLPRQTLGLRPSGVAGGGRDVHGLHDQARVAVQLAQGLKDREPR